MAKEKHVSATPATDWLKAHKVNFKLHTYDFVPHGGTTQGAKELGIDNHVMIKTLIMEDENAEPLVILMHGDCEVSTKNLAPSGGKKTYCSMHARTGTEKFGLFCRGHEPLRNPKENADLCPENGV